MNSPCQLPLFDTDTLDEPPAAEYRGWRLCVVWDALLKTAACDVYHKKGTYRPGVSRVLPPNGRGDERAALAAGRAWVDLAQSWGWD